MKQHNFSPPVLPKKVFQSFSRARIFIQTRLPLPSLLNPTVLPWVRPTFFFSVRVDLPLSPREWSSLGKTPVIFHHFRHFWAFSDCLYLFMAQVRRLFPLLTWWNLVFSPHAPRFAMCLFVFLFTLEFLSPPTVPVHPPCPSY